MPAQSVLLPPTFRAIARLSETDVSFSSSLALYRVPYFAPATLAVLLTVLAEAMAGSYTALLAVQKLGMSPLELSAFLTLAAGSGIIVTTIFGHMHDRRARMWPVYLSLVGKIGASALCVVVTEPWALYLVAVVLFGLSSATFPLLFAIAKGYLDRAGSDATVRGMASLRMTSSLGWAIGPAIAAGLVATWSFAGVFLGSAVLGVIALVTVALSGIRPQPNAGVAPPKVTLEVVRATAPAVIALTAFNTAMLMGGNAMSVVVVRELGSEADVGLLLSLCALLEVFIMGAFVVRPSLSHHRGLLLAGFGLFVAYFVLVLAVPTLAALYWGQIPRAAAIGIVSIVGMARLQDMLPGRAGIASALFGNTMSAGALLSGLGTGVWAEAFGYWSLFAVGAVLCVIGGVAMAWPARAALSGASSSP